MSVEEVEDRAQLADAPEIASALRPSRARRTSGALYSDPLYGSIPVPQWAEDGLPRVVASDRGWGKGGRAGDRAGGRAGGVQGTVRWRGDAAGLECGNHGGGWGIRGRGGRVT